MASPFGHTLVSCYFIKPCADVEGRKPLLRDALLMMVLASAPDLDIFVGPHEWITSLFHRTISHSFFFALWLGCVLALAHALYDKGPLLKRAALYSAVLASHPLIDYFTVIPPYVGAMPLFWPLSWKYFASPVALLPGAMSYRSGIPVAQSLVRTFVGEAVLIVPLLAYEAARAWARAGRQAPVSFARMSTSGV